MIKSMAVNKFVSSIWRSGKGPLEESTITHPNMDVYGRDFKFNYLPQLQYSTYSLEKKIPPTVLKTIASPPLGGWFV